MSAPDAARPEPQVSTSVGLTRWQTASPVVVWAGAVAAAVVIALTVRPDYLTWLPIAMAGVVIFSFLIQLGIQRKEGFVHRMMLSVAGGLIVLAVATALFALVP